MTTYKIIGIFFLFYNKLLRFKNNLNSVDVRSCSIPLNFKALTVH